MGTLKLFFIAGGLVATLVAGDHYNVLDKFFYPYHYREKKVEEGFYPEPFVLEKRYLVNEKGNLEVYIGKENEWVPVTQSALEKDPNKDTGVVEKTIHYLDETVDYFIYLNEKFGWFGEGKEKND